jgi:hypothetical protein
MGRAAALAPLLALAVALPGAWAQAERSDDIVGRITRVDGSELTIRRDGGGEIRLRVTADTRVEFRDAGDKRAFPNPSTNDLREGMGVRLPAGADRGGVLERIVVHHVPPEAMRGQAGGSSPTLASEGRQVKARILAVGRREIRADVAGRETTYQLDTLASASRFRAGDLVILTLDDRDSRLVTRIETAELRGSVVEVDVRARTITLDVDGRDETYGVENRDLLDELRRGDRVRFEVEERTGGQRVITSLARLR